MDKLLESFLFQPFLLEKNNFCNFCFNFLFSSKFPFNILLSQSLLRISDANYRKRPRSLWNRDCYAIHRHLKHG